MCERISVRAVRGKNDKRKRESELGAGLEVEGMTAANQITVSRGCLMSMLLCDSLLAALSTMKKCKTRFSTVPHASAIR